MIVTFDEHGGFFDHVAPCAAVPPGDLQTASYVHNNFKFDQLGVRVPALVISPFTPRGVIDHTVYDHTSMLATVERLFGLGAMTNRDRAAKDVRGLLSLATPRTDCPTALPPVAVNPDPLDCGDDNDSKDALLLRRSQLRLARGVQLERAASRPLTRSTQTGFLQVALLKALQDTPPPDRQKWIDDYKAIRTHADASLFMVEATLKVKHGIDVRKTEREGAEAVRQKQRRDRR